MTMFDRFRDRDRKVFDVCPVPVITSAVESGSLVEITGTDFGVSQSSGKVEGYIINSWTVLSISGRWWSDTLIEANRYGSPPATKVRVTNYCGKLSNEEDIVAPPGAWLWRVGRRIVLAPIQLKRRLSRKVRV